ncbi:DUF7556 family protein [Halonotius terrestris]|uniref:DUF7556 family protein n=1 Tax=Halonotius terrestris TaxID=2487750 RepID=UPI00163C7E8E|nr:hypothetical protein [Halonotius terrestris]
MTQDHTPVGDSEAEVMAAVDDASSRPAYVIADISRDEAWLSVRERDALVLNEWC